MKIIKFIKKYYKRLVIQFVSVISALVIFCIPCYAENTLLEVSTVDFWCTNFSVRSGNFNGDNWGSVVENWSIRNMPFYPAYSDISNDDDATGRVAQYTYEDNSIELQGKYLVSTWQLYDDSIEIREGHVYQIAIPLVFVMETNKTIITDYLKFSLWDRNNSSTPYYSAITNEKFTWKPTKYDGYYELLYTITLKNYSDVSIVPNYIRMAIRINNTLKFWQDNEFGFSNSITVEDLGNVEMYETVDNSSLMIYGSMEDEILNSTKGGRDQALEIMDFTDGDISLTNGMLAVTNIANKFVDLPPFKSILTFGLSLGIAAFLLGVGAISLFKGKSKNKSEKGSDE